ncbi:O-antigen ligase family protein [Aestuariirhabdus litorea]|uniref:O-antigen ligase domain-containing protein n=1 Tax=Aestuariirhabdus litorea TaxID=2528527 RepID=A0A3P3VNE6_9GAMM|nr:O-antigen ligase family protein [Aestuariirhabdus litorea]RRJ82353.1 hypothetical protein D0544_10735 [Aestuariirhabdus litorea]RWW92517.1 hypothetical protein DZC74_10715 [Endozoicomonadaceae bacterium GTF-13]
MMQNPLTGKLGIEPGGRLEKVLGYWLAAGLLFLAVGMLLLESRNGYKNLVYLGLALPGLVLLFTPYARHLFSTPAFGMLSLYLLWVLLSCLWSPADEGIPIKRALIFALVCSGLAYLFGEQRRRFEQGALAALALGAAISLWWLIDFYGMKGFALSVRFPNGITEEYGSIYNPLLMSHQLAFLVTFATAYILLYVQSPKQRRALLVLVMPIALLMLATGSRTPLVSVPLALSMLLVGRFNRMHLPWVLLSGGGLLLLGLLNWETISQRGLSYRPEIWSGVIAQMEGYWLVGHGYEAPLQIWVEELQINFLDAHNVFLGVLYYFGLLGLGIFLLPYLRALWLARLPGREGRLLLCITAYGVLASLTDGGGLFARPNEQWFNIWLPILFIVCVDYGRTRLAADEEASPPHAENP